MTPDLPIKAHVAPAVRQPEPGFGGNPLSVLANRYVDAYEWVGATRSREMIGEDFLGNGLLRTMSDAVRGLVFGTGHLNWVLGRERITREASSILTDNISAGVMAHALGALVDRHLGTLTNSNIHLDILSLVRAYMPDADHYGGVLTKIRQAIASAHPSVDPASLEGLLNPTTLSNLIIPDSNHPEKAGFKEGAVQALAAELAKTLKLEDFSLSVHHPVRLGETPKPVTHELPRFLEDLALLGHGLAQKPWEQASGILSRTHHWKLLRIGLLSTSLGLTMAVPHFNKWLTRQINGIDYYPGDEGLVNAPRTRLSQQGYQGTGLDLEGLGTSHPLSRPDWRERLFPFVSEQWKQGNPLPAVGAALPLVFAVGLFRTGPRRFIVPALKAFEWRLPALGQFFKPGEHQGAVWMQGLPARQWVRDWAGSLDYERGFPWTTQQQMAMLFAGLITSRIASARSANEYRERTVDGVLGWGLWILGSPVIRPLLGKQLFQAEKFELLRPDRSLRSASELATFATEALKKKGIPLQQAQRQLSVVQATAFGLNVLLMGIVEPFVSMMTTLAYNQRGSQPPSPEVSTLLKQAYPSPPSLAARRMATFTPSAEIRQAFSS